MEPHYGRDRRVTGMPGSHPAPRECLCSTLGTSRSWGRAEWDYSSSLLLLLLPLAGWGGVPAQPQPWPQPWAVVQGSKVTSKSGTACGQCLAKVPGSCWAILGAGQAAGMGAPSPALCSIRRGAQAQGELSQGAALPALAPTGLLFSAHDLPFLLGRSQVRDIQESPWDEFPSEEAVSPSPPAGLASRPARHTEGHPLPLDTSCQVQLGANLPSCSWVLVIQA